MPNKQLPPEVLDFLRNAGSKGGKKTVKKYGREQMAEWGKLGGRPSEQAKRRNVNEQEKRRES